VRRELFAQNEAKVACDDALGYLGVVVVLGIVEDAAKHPLLHQRVFQTKGGTTRMYVMPFTVAAMYKPPVDHGNEYAALDTVMWQLSFPMDEAEAKTLCRDKLALKRHCEGLLSEFHAPLPDMLARTEVGAMMGTPTYDRDPVDFSELGLAARVTLLGDAAHPMSPFKGQGANQALLDAVDLSKALAQVSSMGSDEDVGAAIRAYEDVVYKRTEGKVLDSRARVPLWHGNEEEEEETKKQGDATGEPPPADSPSSTSPAHTHTHPAPVPTAREMTSIKAWGRNKMVGVFKAYTAKRMDQAHRAGYADRLMLALKQSGINARMALTELSRLDERVKETMYDMQQGK
jgi:hypothetical protein